MAFIELEPPRLLPRGMNSERPSQCGSGSGAKSQSSAVWNCLANAAGILMFGWRVLPPASRGRTPPGGVLAEPVGEHAAGRAGADDDVVHGGHGATLAHRGPAAQVGTCVRLP